MSRLWMGYVAGLFTVACLLTPAGCARVHGGGGGASEHALSPVSAEIEGEFKLVWDAVKDVLRDKPVEIYTRDKRGRFVVFANKGRAFLTPRRLRLVITIQPLAENRSRVTIETYPEAYTVQLLTIPAWRPAAFGDNALATEILDSLQQRVRAAKR